MIEIKELIEPIPDGRKRSYLGNTFVKALTNYYEDEVEKDLDVDELVVNNFEDLILNDKFLKDLTLFVPEKLNETFQKEKTFKKISIRKLREHLISYFNLVIEVDKFEPKVVFAEALPNISLHDFQERVRRKVINLIFNQQKRFLIHMPTGSGKTRTTGEILIDFIRLSSTQALLNDKLKILWVAQSGELCSQAYETVKWLLENKSSSTIHIGHFYGEHSISPELLDKPAIVFCSVQKLLLHYQEEIWKEIKNNNYLVIVDEAHRSVAKKWVKALDFFVDNPSVYLLGLTATPGLGKDGDNNSLLATYYNNNKITISDNTYREIPNPIHYLIRRKFLAEIERIDIDSNVFIQSGVKYENDEFNFSDKTLKELSINASRNSSIINILRENYKLDKKILVFTCGLDHNRILQAVLRDIGIPSESVDQQTKNRESIIHRFKNEDLKILLNYGVLTTGFDAPKTDVCIIARPVTSIVMYSQMVGRILRGPLNNGNRKNILYTIKDNFAFGNYDDMFNSFNEFYK